MNSKDILDALLHILRPTTEDQILLWLKQKKKYFGWECNFKKAILRYRITDAQEMHERYPETFWIPSPEGISKLKKGDSVKLIFTLPDGSMGERMWVLITNRNKNSFLGTLDNEPIGNLGLEHGAKISFESRHIIGIWN